MNLLRMARRLAPLVASAPRGAVLRGLAAATLALPLLAACTDPCTGVASCGEPVLRYRGQLVERYSGVPADSVRIEFVRTSGADTGPSPIVAYTDAQGRFELRGEAAEHGQVAGMLRVVYWDTLVVEDRPITLATARSRGEVRDLGEWRIRHPHFSTYGQLFFRGSGELARGVEIEFRRTGGIPVEPELYVARSDSFGNFPLRPQPLDIGEVVGDVTIRPGGGLSPRTIRDVRFSSYVGDDPNPYLVRWGIGPHLPRIGQVVYQDTGLPAAGIPFEFRRTGGIPVDPVTFSGTTNEWGGFGLDPAPLAEGELIGEITFRPPAPYSEVTYTARLETTNEDVPPSIVFTWVIPAP